MTGFKHTALLALMTGLFGCGSEAHTDHEREQPDPKPVPNTTPPADLPDLYEVFATALDNGWGGGCDVAATADYYRNQADQNWKWVDLNGDGQDEAICFGVYAIYPGQHERMFIGGATGNTPCFAFEQRGGRWFQIAELSGIDHNIHDKKVNGWAVLSSSWKISISEYPVQVLVYEGDAYKPIYQYTTAPTYDP